MRTLIRQGNILVGYKHRFLIVDLLIENGRIAKIADHIVDQSAKVIQKDISRYFIVPSFIDLHCHLREPGQTHKESIKTGTMAAAKGGYTKIVAMGNTSPTVSSAEVYYETQEIIKNEAVIPVIQAGTITQDLEGKKLSEVFQQNLCQVYSDDGKGIQDQGIMLQAVRLAKKNKSMLILHEEDNNYKDYRSESVMLERDIKIAIQEEYPLHFTHLSSKESIKILKKNNIYKRYFSADTTPHHIFFSDYQIEPGDTHFKVNPPILTKDDRKALYDALFFKLITSIASDHAPHSQEEKEQPYEKAPFGISGFETAFPACFTIFQNSLTITFKRLIDLFTINPAKLLHIDHEEGSLEVGKKANLVFFDKRLEKKVNKDQLLSKGKNTPFHDRYLTGWPVLTILEGEKVYEDCDSRLNW